MLILIPAKLRYVKRNVENIFRFLRVLLWPRRLAPLRFVIFTRGRSGSTALVSLLRSIPGLHCDTEILNGRVLFPWAELLDRCMMATSNVYGCKILTYQIYDVQPIKNPENFLQELSAKGFKIIYLKRDNLLDLAISNIRARQLGFHQRVSNSGEAPRAVINRALKVDLQEVVTWLDKLTFRAEQEMQMLNGCDYLELSYELDLADQLKQSNAIQKVCQFLDITFSSPRCDFQKISPSRLVDSVENYGELREYLAGTKYDKFIPKDL